MTASRPIYWLAFVMAYVFIAAVTVRADLLVWPVQSGKAAGSHAAAR